MIPSFRIGGDTGVTTPEAIKRQRAVSLALLKQASDTGPTDVYGGVARLGQGVISALMNRRADKQEKRGMDEAQAEWDRLSQNPVIAKLMGGQATPTPMGGASPKQYDRYQEGLMADAALKASGAGPRVMASGSETVNPSPYEMQGIPDPRSPEFTLKDDRQLPIVGGPGMIHAAPAPDSQPQAQPQPMPQGNELQAAAQEVDALPMGEIMQLMNNPYLGEGQRSVLQMVIKSKFDRGEWRSLGDGRIFNSGTGEVQDLGQKQEPTKMPSSVQEYEYAKGQGFKGTFQDWQSLNKSGTEVNVNMPGQVPDANLQKNLDDEQAKVWSEYLRAGAVSGANSQDFAILDELLQIAPQGPIQGRLAQAFPGFSSAGDAVQSIVKRIAPTLRAPGSGATSDIEYQGMLDSLPALRNNPNANRMILEIMRAKADLNVKRADIISRYRAREIDAATAMRGVAELDKVSIITPAMREALIGIQRPEAVEIDGYTIEPIGD